MTFSRSVPFGVVFLEWFQRRTAPYSNERVDQKRQTPKLQTAEKFQFTNPPVYLFRAAICPLGFLGI